MKVIILMITFLPTLIESYLDRFGETKKSKIKDTLWLVMEVIVSLWLAYWLFDISPVWPAILILMFRFCTFDYLVHWFLKRYSENHGHINIWSYTGESTYWWDQLTSKVDWRLRIVIRLCVFALAVLYFLWPI